MAAEMKLKLVRDFASLESGHGGKAASGATPDAVRHTGLFGGVNSQCLGGISEPLPLIHGRRSGCGPNDGVAIAGKRTVKSRAVRHFVAERVAAHLNVAELHALRLGER